ncbi:MAG: adenylosuccinate synthase [Clostridiales Family XIII bacterium]|jgi:adenylosuccinate synthase|nr:adenylosuccinate synthase [Clostridiales Family XIII bacterium]
MKNVTAVIGSQWGDEGKGKIIDYLASKADMVVRAQGGGNAGHTVVIEGKKYALHLVPSGVLNAGTINIIGNGVAFDPADFFSEIEELDAGGANIDGIYVSDRAHIVFPYHKTLDALAEKARGSDSIGTTLKGIGPCYTDKVERCGLRVCDLLDEDSFRAAFAQRVDAKNEIIVKLYGGTPLDKEAVTEEYVAYGKRLAPYVRDTSVMVHEAISAGKTVLLEGAQGSMLDLDFGTYPFVTSSHPTSGGFAVGAGIGLSTACEVIGITKAYTTRVGAGPMVTELTDEVGDMIREKGREFGTTTGRPRRCGWFDGVVVRHSARINGMTSLALMLLDVLDDFDEIKLCHAYEKNGEILEYFPASAVALKGSKPLYRTVKGWNASLTECRTWDDLPANAKAYISAVEEIAGVPVKIVSVGSGREHTIAREDIL